VGFNLLSQQSSISKYLISTQLRALNGGKEERSARISLKVSTVNLVNSEDKKFNFLKYTSFLKLVSELVIQFF
jgi:hypothetical protein